MTVTGFEARVRIVHRIMDAIGDARGFGSAVVAVEKVLDGASAREVADITRAMTGGPAARGRADTIERLVTVMVRRTIRHGVVVRGYGRGTWRTGTVVDLPHPSNRFLAFVELDDGSRECIDLIDLVPLSPRS